MRMPQGAGHTLDRWGRWVKVVFDQSLIGSGVARVRRNLPRFAGERMSLEAEGFGQKANYRYGS
jgi:hypothetical protein